MQLGLALSIPASRWLSSDDTVRDWLRCTHEQVLAAIDSGVIPFAFDLRAPAADRALVRLWHPNVEALVRSAGRDSGPRPPLEDLLAGLMPDAPVRSSALELWWSVSHQHIAALIAAGELPVLRRGTAAHGLHSAHHLSGSGLRAFLRARRIGAVPQAGPVPAQAGLACAS